jgi:CO/xanthine dehydrogenase Mo-binding subunit
MVHGRVVRPPALGATLQSVDENSVKNIPGLIKIVREGNFLGVVSETEWGAIKAAQNLRVTWSKWEGLPEQKKLFEHVRATKINKEDVTSNIGNVPEALQQGTKTLKATYDFAIHTHGSIGPSCAIAEIKNGQLACWTASQATHNLKKQLAAMMNMPVESVRCIYLEGSGCYGRNGHEDAAGDAALLARAVGRPVRVQWMRADEHGWDPKGPPTLIDLHAAIDANGEVIAWESEFFVPEGAAGNVPLIAASLAACHMRPRTRRATSSRTRRFLTRFRISGRFATALLRPRSGRPGSVHPGGCRTPTQTKPSWTSSQRLPGPIRSTSA